MANNKKFVQRKADAKRRNDRTRNWTIIVYPDSAPENWKEILDNEHIPWIQSPLHDKDINEADNEPKKPHWHILLTYSGLKSYSQMKELCERLNAPEPQKCSSAQGMVRYMAHKDNPEKYQYNPINIIGHGGADVEYYLEPLASERTALLKEMVNFCRHSGILSYSELVNYAIDERPYDWFPLLMNNGNAINNYLKSTFAMVRSGYASKK